MTGDAEMAITGAALQVDLLNNVDRDGGYEQQMKLACICTAEQIAAYNAMSPEGKAADRKRQTRNFDPAAENSDIRDWLDESNQRLEVRSSHPGHTMGRHAVA